MLVNEEFGACHSEMVDKQPEHRYLLNRASRWLPPCHAAQPGRGSSVPGLRSSAREPRTSMHGAAPLAPDIRVPVPSQPATASLSSSVQWGQ